MLDGSAHSFSKYECCVIQMRSKFETVMTTTVRVSPLGVFWFVCGAFIILYALKNVMFADEYTTLLQEHKGEKIPVKRLLETSIYLAEKGGTVLKDIRKKSELKVCSRTI